jgi:Calcium-binding EGF domain
MCGETRNCHVDAICTLGSFTCSCKSGVFGNGAYCADIDECHLYTRPGILYEACREGSTCVNTLGSYICKNCPQGYNERDGCKDIDECSNDGHNECSEFSQCAITPASAMLDIWMIRSTGMRVQSAQRSTNARVRPMRAAQMQHARILHLHMQ